jgi:hypothetical protein
MKVRSLSPGRRWRSASRAPSCAQKGPKHPSHDSHPRCFPCDSPPTLTQPDLSRAPLHTGAGHELHDGGLLCGGAGQHQFSLSGSRAVGHKRQAASGVPNFVGEYLPPSPTASPQHHGCRRGVTFWCACADLAACLFINHDLAQLRGVRVGRHPRWPPPLAL